jgi:hypothetical protein
MLITGSKTANNSEEMAILAGPIPRISAPDDASSLIIRCKKQQEQPATCTCAAHFTPDLRCASGRYAALSEEFAGFP